MPWVASAAEDAVAEVAALEGDGVVVAEGTAPRPLSCGEPIFAGEVVVTRAASRVGVLAGDVLAQLDADSELRVGSAGGQPTFVLEKGAVRLIDPRERESAGMLAALDLRAAVAGNDVEAYLFEEKTGRYAMFCEWDAPLQVMRGPSRASVGPGHCAIARSGEAIYLAEAHRERLAAPQEEACTWELAGGGLERHFLPEAVAAPPPLQAFSSLPEGPTVPLERGPCDDPGSGCLPGASTIVIEPPPAGGGFPGASSD